MPFKCAGAEPVDPWIDQGCWPSSPPAPGERLSDTGARAEKFCRGYLEWAESPINRLNSDMFVGHQAADVMEDDVILTKEVLIRKIPGEVRGCSRLKSGSHDIWTELLMSHVFMMTTVPFVTLLDYRGPLYDNIAALSGHSAPMQRKRNRHAFPVRRGRLANLFRALLGILEPTHPTRFSTYAMIRSKPDYTRY